MQTCVVHLIRAAMRFVSYPRPQGRHRRAEADLSGRERRDSACRARRLRGDRAGQGATPRPARHSVTRVGAVHALPRVPARTAARDLYDQLDRVAQLPAAQDHPGTAATSPTITRSSSCSGWRSATSKTNERATGRKNEVSAPSNAKHPDASSRARPRRTGNKHCNNSHWSTPTTSTPTSDHHDHERLHKELDRLRPRAGPSG